MSGHSNLRAGAAMLSVVLLSACSFISTATHWNGRVGPDGRPVFVKTSTNVGFCFLIVIPLIGNLNTDQLVDVTTAAIMKEKGDMIRVVETGSNNGWNGLPPVTLFFTPVITRISIEYQPSAEELEKARQEQAREGGVQVRDASFETDAFVPPERHGGNGEPPAAR